MNSTLIDRFLKIRKKIIENEFSQLNDMQLQAVMATEGPLLLLAGAGSGKTTVLINRVANIIKFGRAGDSDELPSGLTEADVTFLEGYLDSPSDTLRMLSLCRIEPVAPWNVLAITFTNKAANELKERLAAALGSDAHQIWAATFHSTCVRILRREADKIGYSTDFTIYDSTDSERVMKDVLRNQNLDEKVFAPKLVLNYISRAKDAFCLPEEYEKEQNAKGDRRMMHIARCYTEYQKRLKASNAMDFDDLIVNTVMLLMENDDTRAYYQRKFKYILVDEYQDTSNIQYLLTKYLSDGYKNICVVGDDDQSIYRFRGATIENILNFENQYKNARTIRLEQNYRSTKHILEAANDVIKNNEGRKGKHLWTAGEEGKKLIHYVGETESDEANYIAGKILAGFAQQRRWSNFAVLYRINALSNQLEYAFKRNGIPYKVVGGTGFFDRAEIKDMLAYLCVIHNSDDDLRLKRIINVPARGIGKTTIDTLEETAQAHGISMFSAIKRSSEFPELQKSRAKLAAFENLISNLRGKASSLALPDFYDEVINATGYITALEAKDKPDAQSHIENVRELKSSILGYMQNTEEPSLAGFLDEAALYTSLDSVEDDGDFCVMMTIHNAKGLEFPTVFICGAEEGIFPGLRAIGDPEEIEEERRLCYVGITRAKQQLYITGARRRMLYGRTSANLPSRFIEEISTEHIDSIKKEYIFHSDIPAEPIRKKPTYIRPPQRSARSGFTASKPQKNVPSFAHGEMVEHTAFGKGMITSVQKMGGDMLLEIAFDNVGTKKLLANSASKHMKKI